MISRNYPWFELLIKWNPFFYMKPWVDHMKGRPDERSTQWKVDPMKGRTYKRLILSFQLANSAIEFVRLVSISKPTLSLYKWTIHFSDHKQYFVADLLELPGPARHALHQRPADVRHRLRGDWAHLQCEWGKPSWSSDWSVAMILSDQNLSNFPWDQSDIWDWDWDGQIFLVVFFASVKLSYHLQLQWAEIRAPFCNGKFFPIFSPQNIIYNII